MAERDSSDTASRTGLRPWHAITAVAVAMALIATVLTVVVADRAARIGDQLQHSNATLIAQQSDEAADTSPTTALQMALAAYREKPDSPEAYGALLEQRLYWRGVDRIYQDAGEPAAIQSSVDGKVVLVVPRDPNDEVAVWHDPTSDQRRRHNIPVDSAAVLRLSPDGRWLAEPRGSTVRLWDLVGSGPPRTLRAPAGASIEAVDFSANGRFLAARPVVRDAGAVLPVWNVDTGASLRSGVRTGGNLNVTEAHPSRDGKALVVRETSAGGQRTVVRDRVTGAQQRSFGPDEILGFGDSVVSCDDGGVSVRDTRTGASRGHLSGVECPVHWDLSEQYLLLTEHERQDENYTAAVHWPSWRRHFFAEPARQRALGATPLLIADSERTLTALMVADGTLRSNRLRTSAESREIAAAGPRSTDRFPPRRREVTYTDSGRLALLDADGRILREVDVPEPVDAVSFDTTGKRVLTASGSTLRIYDGERLSLRHEKSLPGADGLTRMTSSASILPWAPDEVLVVHAGMLTYWNPRTGEQTSDPLRVANGNGSGVGAATLRPEHSQVLVEQGDELALWDFEKRKLVHSFPVDLGERTQPVFDASGSVAAVTSGSGHEVALFDFDRKVRLPGIDTEVTDVHGIADRYVFVESALEFQMWDWRQRKLVTSIRLDDGYRAGRREIIHHDRFDELVTNSTPGRREVLTLEAENWYSGLCSLSNRPFTRAERRLLPAGVSTEPPCSGVLS